jgi:L-threonylcarbamoyladenylate synthase
VTGDAATAESIREAVAVLARGGLVAFPTETVYGLGADASNETAVRRIFAVKGRPADHPLIVHLARAEQLRDWVLQVPAAAWRLAEAFWPGPLTLVLPRAPHVLDVVTGGQDTVGIRIPSHPVAQALLQRFGGGIAGPSANRFGRISPTTAAHVRAELGDAVDLVLEGGQSQVGIESTIVDLSSAQPALLRPGIIGARRIATVLGVALQAPGLRSPRASGMLASHYAPLTPTHLVSPERLERDVAAAETGRIGVLARRPTPSSRGNLVWVQGAKDAEAYAHDLYASLRALDAAGCDRILVEAVPEDPAWDAVRDRLARAAVPLPD